MVRHPLTSVFSARSASRRAAAGGLLLASTVFALLWLLNIPFRRIYQASDNDVTALVDGSLLLPGARWQDWFTHGHSHFFDSYPEWPWGLTPFARPAFQCLIYLAHFVFGRDWPSYLAINYLAVAGIAAVVFAIARTRLELGGSAALLAALLTAISPAVLEFSIWEVGFASESAVCVLAGCAFLAVTARRDFLGAGFLLVALFTKETAVWTPLAAALTVLFRDARNETPRQKLLRATTMLVPFAAWLGYRLAYFGGIGGSYATGGYAEVSIVTDLIAWKLTHLQRLFVSQQVWADEGGWASIDRGVMVATYLLVALQMILLALTGLRAVVERIDRVNRERRWPSADGFLLTLLWGGAGFAFYFALALSESRYAASAVMFLWPVAVAAAVRRGHILYRIGLAACFVLMLGRTSLLLAGLNPPLAQSYVGRVFHSVASMEAALRGTPARVGQVYVLSSGGLVTASPQYLQAFLDVRFEIIRVADIHWACGDRPEFAAFEHESRAGEMTLSASLPAGCASFFFDMAGSTSTALADGRLQRGGTITYDLPDAYLIDQKGPLKPALEPGRRMIVHLRPAGPARVLVQDPRTGAITWFDIP